MLQPTLGLNLNLPRDSNCVIGAARGFLIGEGEGTWDAIFIFEYPSTQVMLDMFRDETYQGEVQPHRAAALEGQLLIECGPGFDLE